jgi:hypothetical protein
MREFTVDLIEGMARKTRIIEGTWREFSPTEFEA